MRAVSTFPPVTVDPENNLRRFFQPLFSSSQGNRSVQTESQEESREGRRGNRVSLCFLLIHRLQRDQTLAMYLVCISLLVLIANCSYLASYSDISEVMDCSSVLSWLMVSFVSACGALLLALGFVHIEILNRLIRCFDFWFQFYNAALCFCLSGLLLHWDLRCVVPVSPPSNIIALNLLPSLTLSPSCPPPDLIGSRLTLCFSCCWATNRFLLPVAGTENEE